MGSFSDWLEDELLDHVFMTSWAALTNLYVGLSTADPLDDASGLAEPSGNGYARVSTAASDWNAATGSPSTVDNANAITFPEATGSWGTVTHFAIFDAATLGNMLMHGSLTASKTIGSGDTASFAAGDLDVTLD
jgi:hypothetical protein